MNWRSRLIQPQRHAPEGFRSLAQPVYRGSTVVFESQAKVSDDWQQRENGYTYGVFGTPTVLELGARIGELEGARHTFITPGGQAAIAMIYLTLCRAGSHVLLPRTAYAPNAELGRSLMRRFGVEVEGYDPLIGSGIAGLIRQETSLIWCESPESITMEVQDVPAIARAARERGVPVALDNTYAAGVLFDAFRFGVDVSMQALTKYVGGHSDLLLGSVSMNDGELYQRFGETQRDLGMAASPDDCSLALRGLLTMGVRLEALERSTLAIAKWLAEQPEIDRVLHPALESCPGHEIWKRDFTGSASLFSILFAHDAEAKRASAFVDALQMFKIGWSWGGVTSLAVAYPGMRRLEEARGHSIVRLNIGLEDCADLKADLARALALVR